MKVFEILTECRRIILVKSNRTISEISEILLKNENLNCYSFTEVEYEPLDEHISYMIT